MSNTYYKDRELHVTACIGPQFAKHTRLSIGDQCIVLDSKQREELIRQLGRRNKVSATSSEEK